MRVLVYPHDLKVGGSQLNAIELAAETKASGHDVIVYGQPGPLCRTISDLGLEFVPSPRARRRPTPSIVTDLRRLVRQRRIDIVHGYEWPPILESRLAVAWTPAVCVGTVMSMSVAPYLPTDLPLVVGTEQIAAAERSFGRDGVTVIEPPVDVRTNGPEHAGDVDGFRQAFGVPSEGPHVVVVSRLTQALKLEGILAAIDVVPRCGATLTIVGGGPAEPVVRDAVDRANGDRGGPPVILTGEVYDPRPAYAMADVVLGMGGSALRAMAFAKPLVVQGESGFWRTLTPETLDEFLWTGWYGVGSDPGEGRDRLREELAPLLGSADRRAELGAFSRTVVDDRFALTAAAQRQVDCYHRAKTHRASSARALRSGAWASARFAAATLARQRDRWAGRASDEDFNARPVAAAHRAS